jgi:metal-responsive CopG/Arc/MetJ family transcriptional regulator
MGPMARITMTFSISLPPEMAEEIERVRKTEHRTRSEFIREALRFYLRVTRGNSLELVQKE